MKSAVAYVDDSQINLDVIETILSTDFAVSTFPKPSLFLDHFPKTSFSAILLDIHMPSIDGFELYDKIIQHAHYNGCPILIISSDTSHTLRIRSLELGAVDFMDRATSPDEMIARVKSKIQFFKKHRSIIEFGPLKVNLTLLKTYLNNHEVPLTFIELKILCFVLRNYPDPVSKDVLVDNVWKNVQVLDATIHTHVFNLNAKLEKWDHEIQMIRNKGIQLVPREEE